MVTEQIHKEVRMLIEELPEDQREVVMMRHYANLSFKEIADIMDCDEQVITTDVYTEYVQNLPTISAKRAFNDIISGIVRSAGLSSEFSMSEVSESDLSWSNPSTLPTFGDLIRGDNTASKLIRLPEQDIPRGIGDEEKRRLVLKALRKHWHRRNDRDETKV